MNEFQAVLLAGGLGSRFTELTTSFSKCLLPVRNIPLISYSLQMLLNLGFKEVIVITRESSKNGIQALGFDIILDFTILPSDDLGTADALRLVYSKLVSQSILVVSSDVLTNFSIHKLADLHRIHRSSLTVLFSKGESTSLSSVSPGPKSKSKSETEIVGIDPSSQRLCVLTSMADIDEENLSLRFRVLSEHPELLFESSISDSHIYILDKTILDFIANDDSLSSLKNEVLPYVVKKQFSGKFKNRIPECLSNKHSESSLSERQDLFSFLSTRDFAPEVTALSGWVDSETKDPYHNRFLRCYAIVTDEPLARVNNLGTYVGCNRQPFGSKLMKCSGNQVLKHPSAKLSSKAIIGEDVLVGDGTTISEKTTISNCVIGRFCTIEPKVILSNCILMDHVIIKSGCELSGSLLCNNVTCEFKVKLKDCIVGNETIVSQEVQKSNELIQKEDQMMIV